MKLAGATKYPIHAHRRKTLKKNQRSELTTTAASCGTQQRLHEALYGEFKSEK